jgi:cellulose synthase/poly-beta-1,6-N-acetylglucosamine synthase-like glycosyltransferase
MPTLHQALRTASPRYSPPPTPLASWLIHAAVAVLFLVLVGRALVPDGLLSWSAGLVYVLYDTALLIFTFSQTLPLWRRARTVPAPSRPTLAVIVAAHDEAAALPATLDALLGQSDPAELIVLVDDGSTDDTAGALAAYGLAQPPIGGTSQRGVVRWLRLAHVGKAAAMNLAFPLIDTEVVMTVDADTLLDADAVAEMRRAFAIDPNLAAATGVLTPVCADTPTGRLLQWFQAHEYLRNFLSRYAWMRQDGLLLISGAFAGFRRAAVIKVGGFDPDCLVEDYELIHRLRRYGTLQGLGWTTAVLGAARARTDAPSTIPAFLRQRRRWFGGFLQTQFWYRDMVGNPRYGHLGLRMLPVKAADTFQPIFGLTAFVLLIYYLVTGHWRVLLPVAGVMSAKIVFDLAFFVGSVTLYRNWVGSSGRVRFGTALLAAVVEPFTFQLLRHLGATLGWVSFLTGQMHWEGIRREGIRKADA